VCLKFIVDKCKVTLVAHTGQHQCVLDGAKLQEVHDERDLGVEVSSSLKPSLQCTKAAAKAMQVLGIIKRNLFRYELRRLTVCLMVMYTVFQKKTSTHIIGYKLRNSCPILIIFDIKIPYII